MENEVNHEEGHAIERCKAETEAHIRAVAGNINDFIKELLNRAEVHDASKLQDPELEGFAEASLLGNIEYGSDAYKASMAKLKPIIEHHYANNRHHPEHWPNGVNDMTLIDLLEMLADWKAATARNKNGNIRKSIELNAERFKISTQLREILENTVREHFQD
jgi:hypothetical protein